MFYKQAYCQKEDFTVLKLSYLQLSNRIANNRMRTVCVQRDINTPARSVSTHQYSSSCRVHQSSRRTQFRRVLPSLEWVSVFLLLFFVGCFSFSSEVIVFTKRPATVVLLSCCRFNRFLDLLFSAVLLSAFALKKTRSPVDHAKGWLRRMRPVPPLSPLPSNQP